MSTLSFAVPGSPGELFLLDQRIFHQLAALVTRACKTHRQLRQILSMAVKSALERERLR